LPKATYDKPIAGACREAGIAFVEGAPRWGKRELAMWLIGPYARATRHIACSLPSERLLPGGSPEPFAHEIGPGALEHVTKSAHTEVVEALRRLREPEQAASFAFTMLSAGFVALGEDGAGRYGWLPTAKARRLADRVLSLFAADYLAHPDEYGTEIATLAERHARTTLPYSPKSA
jgi:hypothetical protein